MSLPSSKPPPGNFERIDQPPEVFPPLLEVLVSSVTGTARRQPHHITGLGDRPELLDRRPHRLDRHSDHRRNEAVTKS